MIIDEGIKTTRRYENISPFTESDARCAMDYVASKVRKCISIFGDKFPAPASARLVYPLIDNNDWTNGFWTGLLWLCYGYTDDKVFRDAAYRNCLSFKERIEKQISVDHHDLGFLYSPSCVEGYKLTGDVMMKNAAVAAADRLLLRFHSKGNFIQAWGRMDDPEAYRLIIDCMNNIPLLFWASEATGDGKYADIARLHADTSSKTVIRSDASTHHTFYFDPKTGAPLKGVTNQGFSDDSAWARGQAWGISGFSLAYTYTGKEDYIALVEKVANYFLNRLSADYIPYWDLIFSDGSGEEKDSSAAAVAVCGLLELLKTYDGKYASVYRSAVSAIMRSLAENYTTVGKESTGILMHSVYGKPQGRGIDECTAWGDYYYAEALMRIINPDFPLCW